MTGVERDTRIVVLLIANDFIALFGVDGKQQQVEAKSRVVDDTSYVFSVSGFLVYRVSLRTCMVFDSSA